MCLWGPGDCQRALPRGGPGLHLWASHTEIHCSSLTQPMATVWEVRQCPETGLEGGQVAASQTSVSKLSHAAGAGSRAKNTQSHVDLGRACTSSLHHTHRIIHSFIPSMLIRAPTVCHTGSRIQRCPRDSSSAETIASHSIQGYSAQEEARTWAGAEEVPIVRKRPYGILVPLVRTMLDSSCN